MTFPVSKSLAHCANVARFPLERIGDVELASAAAQGDTRAVIVLWDRYSVRTRQILRIVLGPDGATEALLCRVFDAALRSVSRCTQGPGLLGYLTSAAVRRAALELRRRNVRRWFERSPSKRVIARPICDGGSSDQERRRAFYRALDALTIREQMVFTLCRIEELPLSEVARLLGCDESKAARALAAATVKLERMERRGCNARLRLATSWGPTVGEPRRGIPLDALVELARREAARPIEPEVDRASLGRLVQGFAKPRSRRSIASQWLGPVPKVAWLTIVASIVGGFTWGLASRPIGFVVRGNGIVDDYVRAADEGPVQIDFSDRTKIRAEPGARLRIEERRSFGARILLEGGRVKARVEPRLWADWRFAAGPFEVRVEGARFVLAWEPQSEGFSLELEEGFADIAGPLGPSHVTLRSGQKLEANLSKRSLAVSESRHALALRATPLFPLVHVGMDTSGSAGTVGPNANAILSLATSPPSSRPPTKTSALPFSE